ncbi:NPC intracellular cholesterol transporter 2-like [Pecten maximus]|uniref:NPC intracellular cholesterol transporter 2-like n=1 Tax=Pecten maximus TaxID=6579 RepID=UPI0014582DBC|nr:NPC intracellular cholesterol transporter 2-like [Pecten maximus]
MNTLNILVVFGTLSTISAIHTFKDCGSTSGHITSITVNPCPSEPCALVRGTNVSVEVDFVSNVHTNKVTTSVHGIIAGIPVPFMSTHSCTSNNVHCPISPGVNNVYTNYIPVLQIYPEISLLVKWELIDEQGNDLACFVMPASILDPSHAVVG